MPDSGVRRIGKRKILGIDKELIFGFHVLGIEHKLFQVAVALDPFLDVGKK